MARLLLEHGADVKAANKDGDTAIFHATLTEMAELLLEHGADVNAANKDGETALFHAKSVGVAQSIIKHHPDLEHRNEYGETALQFVTSVMTSNRICYDKELDSRRTVLAEIAETLVSAGANYDPISAIRMGDFERFKTHFDNGTNNNLKEFFSGAVNCGQYEICKLILQRVPNGGTRTMIFSEVAISSLKHPKILELLIKE